MKYQATTYQYENTNKIIDEILRWCVDNSIVDYEEEFSDNGDCIIVLSKLEKFLEGLKQEVKG